MSDEESIEDAIVNGMGTKEAWLEVARAEGRDVPQPGGRLSEKWEQRVPRSLHSRLVDRVTREGVSLNALVVSLIAEGLGKRVK